MLATFIPALTCGVLNAAIFIAYGMPLTRRDPVVRRWIGLAALAYAALGGAATAISLRYDLFNPSWHLPAAISLFVPSVILAVGFGLIARARGPALLMAIAGVLAPVALVVFERGTHGPWYVRSEGVALMLSVLVGMIAWHAPVAGALLYWRRGPRVPRPGVCTRCGYNLAGLATCVCPECGGSA